MENCKTTPENQKDARNKKGKNSQTEKNTTNEGETVNCQNVNNLSYDKFLCKFITRNSRERIRH